MNKILDVVEDIKQNITDKQYITIMESLMEINFTSKTVNLILKLHIIYTFHNPGTYNHP